MHLPSRASFITKDASIDNIKSQYFFIELNFTIHKLVSSEDLFAPNNNDVSKLAIYAKELWLPSPSSVQLAKSKAKDTVFYDSKGRDEDNISKIPMMHSLILSDITTVVKKDDSF